MVTGSLGSETISLAAGTTRDNIMAAINTASASTGVVAQLAGNNMRFTSSSTGSDEFVEISVLSGGAIELVLA